MGRPKGSKNKGKAATQSKVNVPTVNQEEQGQNHAEILTALIEEAQAAKAKTTGVVMIATGHPYYAHMAANLATAIKYQSPGLSITLFHDGASTGPMSDDKRVMFDRMELLPQHVYNGDPFHVKLWLDTLTPYDRTLYLDVDMMATARQKTVEHLLSSLSGVPFTIANRGYADDSGGICQWAKLADVKSTYGVNGVWDVSSEVIYFEGKPSVFRKAREVYEQQLLTPVKFGAGLPDEFFLQVAMELTQTNPHVNGWEPSYWQPRYFTKTHNSDYVQSNYYFLSVGGNDAIPQQRKIYNTLASHFYFGMGGKRIPYQYQPKSKLMKERRNK